MRRCLRCHRRLTDPESVERGVGPVCWEWVRFDRLREVDEEERPPLLKLMEKEAGHGRVPDG